MCTFRRLDHIANHSLQAPTPIYTYTYIQTKGQNPLRSSSQIHHYCNTRAMKPSTTNSSYENQLKNQNPTTDDHDQPLIISCKVTPRQEITKNSSNPSTGVVSEAFLIESAGDEQEKRREDQPTGREKLMRHWKEASVGGRIVIPERWGQEDLLKDWIDYSTFDALLAPKEAHLAREDLVAEARRGLQTSKLRL